MNNHPWLSGLLAALLAARAGAQSMQEPQPEIQPGIPGPWESATPQPLPSLAEVASRPGPGRLVYGLYAWGGEYHKHRAAIQAVGWPSIRIAGPFDDALMQALAEDYVRVMVTLENRLLDAAQGKDRASYASDDELIADFTERAAGFLDRYGPGGSFFRDHPGVPNRPITEVELWNEPNFQYLIPPDGAIAQAELEAKRERLYAKLLRAVYPALKARHPGVTIAGFAGGGMSAGDLRFVDHVLAAEPDLMSNFDVFSTHPYVRPAPPEASLVEPWGSYSIARSIAHHRRTLAAHGGAEKPVWITEIGWPVSQADGGLFPTPADKTFASPLLQAAYICRTYALALRLGVERVQVMFATDTDNFNGGFFLPDGAWRPSARAVQTMIRELPDPKLTGAVSDGEQGRFIYTFNDGKGAEVFMAWTIPGPVAARIPFAAPRATVTDISGQSHTVESAGGFLSLEIGPCPVWIRAASPD